MQQDEKNYITPPGFERLREELRHLRRAERPEVVGAALSANSKSFHTAPPHSLSMEASKHSLASWHSLHAQH